MHSHRYPPGHNDHDGEESPKSQKVVPLRRSATQPGGAAPTPQEPAWARAFTLQDGAIATRTPDRLMRARLGMPEPEPTPPRIPSPTVQNQTSSGASQTTPEVRAEPPVRNQIAELRSRFSAENRQASEHPEALAQKEEILPAKAMSKRDSKDRSLATSPQTAPASPETASAQGTPPIFSIGMTISSLTWQHGFAPGVPSAVPTAAPKSAAGPAPAAAPVRRRKPAEQPAAPVAPVAVDVSAEELESSYLSLYADEIVPTSSRTQDSDVATAPEPEPKPEPVELSATVDLEPEEEPTPASPQATVAPISDDGSIAESAVEGVAGSDEVTFAEIEGDTDASEAIETASNEELPPFMVADEDTPDTHDGEEEGAAESNDIGEDGIGGLPAVMAAAAPMADHDENHRGIVDLPKTGPSTYGEPARPAAEQAWSYEFPDIEFLAAPPEPEGDETVLTEDVLEEAAGKLEKIIRDFGVKGEVVHVHPGPVVTLYEFVPAPGIKSARVIALTEDIARSMSAVSARVAVIPGRNVIGIELPNATRETVYLREILDSEAFTGSTHKMPLCLGKTIGGDPVIADLARMPHLLLAGTTGSGKSVAINTMILSLLYRFTPEQCRLIMVDPKMLELSVYDGIPHLLTPVVTDPKKAIIALRWAVREMEDRYKKMAKLGVRNIDGFNARVTEAREKGEVITRQVQTGFDKATGELTYTEEVMDLSSLPYIVVVVDEMADLMMVAGKEIEGAIQRLAQMARAAGIHVILATQRPSVDVITGTIKANFPTRISFQVTSKIDSRTILGETGAEQLLGQGDMLHMVGGGRIERVHGPFCSDEEVERVVAHLKRQAKPVYLEAVTADDEEEDEVDDTPAAEEEEMGLEAGDLYDQAVSIVLRHKKASTSYIQRRLQIGYNRAASIMERMEKEGVVGPANHAGKREILIGQGGFDDE